MVSDLRLRRLGHARVFSRVVIRRRSASRRGSRLR